MPHLSKIYWAAGAALAFAGCADHPTAPRAASHLPVGTSQADPSAATASRVGSSVTWNGTARDLLTAQAANPFVQVRVLTYLSLAQYNAIIAAKDSKTPGPHPSAAGAAAGASVVVLKDFFPDQAESLEDQIAAQAGENADGSDPRNLNVPGGIAEVHNWSPDGSRIAFGVSRDVWTIASVSSSRADFRVHHRDQPGGVATHPDWSPDGRRLVFNRYTTTSGCEIPSCPMRIFVVSTAGGPARQLIPELEQGPDYWDHQPAWSRATE